MQPSGQKLYYKLPLIEGITLYARQQRYCSGLSRAVQKFDRRCTTQLDRKYVQSNSC